MFGAALSKKNLIGLVNEVACECYSYGEKVWVWDHLENWYEERHTQKVGCF